MSVSTEVRRTLVKSPPELWSELSDPACLAKHLGELGEITIVRTDPEQVVAWEATAADGTRTSGTAQIEPSGWGTKVTLSVTCAAPAPAEPAAPAPAKPEPRTEPQAESVVEPEAEPQSAVQPEPQPEPQSAVEPEPQPEAEPQSVVEPEAEPELERRSGFFARLFSRRKRHRTAEPEPSESIGDPVPDETMLAEPEPSESIDRSEQSETTMAGEPAPADLAPEPEAAAEQPAPEVPTAEPDIAAELAALEEQTTAVLTGVLDRLGAAHHRPFSRA